ncbi:MAG: YidC/Oxa1 family insertase periplasmic-domain containing protein [Planctomycetes bacterium]|jgi:YidC/Oxa1 family membrane protein insertase|nr:YidC/Oxa1 family insertase periplasmic-domain containing protein [Planctomycetota bacterium]
MSFRAVFILILAGFVVLCAGLIVDSGFLRTTTSVSAPAASAEAATPGRGAILLQQTTEVAPPAQGPGGAEPNAPAPVPQLAAPAGGSLGAEGGPRQEVTLGSTDEASGFKYLLVLDSLGAAIRTATFSEYDTRDGKNREPLVFLTPVQVNGRTILSLANGALTMVNQRQRLRLDQLSWRSQGVQQLPEGGQAASFEAAIVDADSRPVLKLTKTYRIDPGTFLLDCTFGIENLTNEQQKVQYEMNGPVGLDYEGISTDMRKAVAGFRTPQGQVNSIRLDLKALSKAAPDRRSLDGRAANEAFLWAAVVNRYFAAIVVPTSADADANAPADWIGGRWGTYYDRSGGRGDYRYDTIGVQLSSTEITLSPVGQPGSAGSFPFDVYLGPKDKGLFDKTDLYRRLGFVQTIDFMACCCPAWLISPLAFGILAVMKWMYFVIPNYGIVIIILVLLMRLVLHPVTRHSQVAMSRMSKLAPRAEEIKKKYGNNKAEMNKKLMELYREQGASPLTAFLPMFVQMPIWIALWSAIYTSIDLRGASFLPVWITDLSAPDAIWKWAPISLPLLGTLRSLNVLPILMGVAFYLQQKLMPMQPPSASTNPQMAQQQKIMAIMLPLMMPLFLYNAPSGVNLYIMASTFGGVIEQYFIKKHIKAREEQEAQGLISATSKTGGKVKKKKPKPFFRFK